MEAIGLYDFKVAIAEEDLKIGLIKRMPKIQPLATVEGNSEADWPFFAPLDCSATRARLGHSLIDRHTNLSAMLIAENALA